MVKGSISSVIGGYTGTPNSGRGDMRQRFKLIAHYQFSLSSANQNYLKWRNQMIINKEKKITIAICHAVNCLTAWSESATQPNKVQLRTCGDSAGQLVFKGLQIINHVGSVWKPIVFTKTLKNGLQYFLQ